MPSTRKANDRFRSASTTRTVVAHLAHPRLLNPTNRAPTSGPLRRPSHRHDVVSGLHSPMRLMSVTRSQTASGGAATVTVARSTAGAVTLSLSVTGRTLVVAP